MPGFVVAFPLLLILVAAIVHVALYEYGRHVVEAAAQEGLAAVRVEGGSAAAGSARTQHVLSAVGHSVVGSASVSVQRDAATARVEVAATTMSLLPFLPARVDAVAEGPLEP